MEYDSPQYPIGYVARRTGLSTHVIRVWEHRYEAVVPARSDTQRRLYSDADIDRLKLLQKLTEGGLSIGRIAQRSTTELKELALDQSDAELSAARSRDLRPEPPGALDDIMAACQSAVIAMDGPALDSTLMQSRVTLSEQVVLEGLVGPLLIWVGDRWHDGTIRVGQEHLATDITKRFLIRMRDAYQRHPDAPTIVISTPMGEPHEIGALLVATIAAIEGWNEVYFGPDLPAAEIANAARSKQACMVALSIATPGDNPRLPAELSELRQLLPESTEVLIGGEGAKRHLDLYREHRMRHFDNLGTFRNFLREVRQGHRTMPAP